MKKFNVLEYNFNSRMIEPYDVLPYFRNQWTSKKFNFDKKDVKTKKDLKNWIKRASHYQFWSRCEYEFIISPWPFNDSSKESIMKDMKKIDVHEQIIFNIDVITDILAEEFKIV